MRLEERGGVSPVIFPTIITEPCTHSDNQDLADVIPEKCTEKLVDLVFVLATKLDLNVNDMRELLENSMKENCQKFDDLSSKLKVEVGDLSEKITKLEVENQAQTERISQLETENSRAAAKHQALLSDLTSLTESFSSVVLTQHGTRLAELEEGQQDLETRLANHNRENINTHRQTLVRMENMERDLVGKVEDTAESLTTAWTRRDEDNKAALAESLAGLGERLEGEERKLSELTNTVETNIGLAREYQLSNDSNIKGLNEILIRFVWNRTIPRFVLLVQTLNIQKYFIFLATQKISTSFSKTFPATKTLLKI